MKKRGNPNLKTHHFKSSGEEPLSSPTVSIRMTQQVYELVMQRESPRDFIREAIREKLEREGLLPEDG